MIILASILIGMGYLLTIQAREEIRRSTRWLSDLDHAAKIFPHPNEKARRWMKQK